MQTLIIELVLLSLVVYLGLQREFTRLRRQAEWAALIERVKPQLAVLSKRMRAFGMSARAAGEAMRALAVRLEEVGEVARGEAKDQPAVGSRAPAGDGHGRDPRLS